MVASISLKHRMARSANAVVSFVPVSLMISGLALVIILTNRFAEEPAIGAANAAVPEFKAQAASPASAMDTVPPADPAPETLTPRMHAALSYVSQRYRVSAAALEPIFGAAQLTGRELRLDPLLIIAVIGIESRFNPFSESSKGAQGLMQVMPRFHQDKLPEGSGQIVILRPCRQCPGRCASAGGIDSPQRRAGCRAATVRRCSRRRRTGLCDQGHRRKTAPGTGRTPTSHKRRVRASGRIADHKPVLAGVELQIIPSMLSM